jgi:hypothetical protein
MQKDHYTCGSPASKPVNFVGARRILSSITTQCRGLGLPMGMSIAMALMLAISTTEDPKLAGTAKGLMPEIKQFLQYVRERSYDMDAFYKKVQARIGATNDKVAPWRCNIGSCWTVMM